MIYYYSKIICLISLCLLLLNKSYSQEVKGKYEPIPKGMTFVRKGSFNIDTTKVSIFPFWISNEVSNKEYRAFMPKAPINTTNQATKLAFLPTIE